MLERLTRHRWPGNVRELENVLELASGEVLELPQRFDALASAPDGAVESFRDGARRIIRAALAAHGGRIYGAEGAAKALGLKPSTLQSKMSRLGIRGALRHRRPPGSLP